MLKYNGPFHGKWTIFEKYETLNTPSRTWIYFAKRFIIIWTENGFKIGHLIKKLHGFENEASSIMNILNFHLYFYEIAAILSDSDTALAGCFKTNLHIKC